MDREIRCNEEVGNDANEKGGMGEGNPIRTRAVGSVFGLAPDAKAGVYMHGSQERDEAVCWA
jgi:hypothetical protein